MSGTSTAGSGNPRTYECAIASPHSLGTSAGNAAIEAGGNALDAALAAAIALTVSYPHNTSIGGDLFALVRDPQGGITSINASGAAAGFTDVTAVRSRYKGDMPVTGVDTITVPGAVGGLAAIHKLGALLPWGYAFTEAAIHADDGIPISPSLGKALEENSALIDSNPGMRKLLHPEGHALSTGDVLRNPALADTLRSLASEGPETLYGGVLGATLIKGLQDLGSVLTLNDLAIYHAQIDSPLSTEFRDLQVWTSPPNSQGFLLLEILSIIEVLPLGMDLLGEDADVLAAIFQLATSDRTRLLADPSYCTSSADQLFSPEYVHAAAKRIVASRYRNPNSPPLATQQRPGGDTVAVVTADTDGWAVSLIQSLFHSFGAGVLEPATGVMLHNRGSFFSLDTSSPNMLAPGKRPAHTLMPAMVTRDSHLEWVMGTMGGKAQPQILTQVLLRAANGAVAFDAIAQPRFIIGGLEVDQPENTVHVEPKLGLVAEALSPLGIPVTFLAENDETAGHAQLISVSIDGVLDAATDPRADGTSIVVQRPSEP